MAFLSPIYIGVDTGCSVTTHKLNKRIGADYLPMLDLAIRRSVPMGMNILKEKNYDNWWVEPYFEAVNENLQAFQKEWTKRFGEEKYVIKIDKEYITAICKKIGMKEENF